MARRVAIVVGATGFTGQFLVKQLCESEEYAAVSVIVRRDFPYRHAKLDVQIKDFDRLEENDLDIADDLFCCLGTTMKKAKSKENFEQVDLEYPLRIASLAKKRGIPNFHVISAIGSNKKSLFFYSQVKGRMEEGLIEMELPHLFIYKPSLLTGGRGEFRLGERLSEGIFQLLNPILIGPLKRMRSIEGKQLAFAMYYYAIHNTKNDVTIYKPLDILNAKPIDDIEEKPISREELFNWDDRKDIFVDQDTKKD
ncbi:NAD-dependent epimerase/dehydratase family protein [Psychrobacillus sp. INOP01]|uniref:NAD-dependent epimerase/dehydratase family protein n=1 Tax=Psychrobacillus sp. INOP01 TaxID=2829187 RepID=UPI001BA6E9F3|nr:NAD-dependent epimerase/dehydratase family protein [Psychrobacillus sp. INOP01]QUG40389.1 NAD-dependent epimerase/dehydratase family protein [Psychrobacillus sp. INOP01]